MVELNISETRALSVLAFLMFRMRRNTSAEHYYMALGKLCPPGSAAYRQAMAGIAAIAIDEKDPEKAQSALRRAMKSGALSSQDSALMLLKAQTLWQQGRHEEAEASLEEYRFLSGTNGEE